MSEIKNRWQEILSENDPSNQTEYNEALAHVRQNFMEIYNDRSFVHLKSEVFCEILKFDDLNVENEEMVFDSVRFWLSFNLDHETHLKPLLGAVRLSLLSTKYLLDEVEPYVYPIKDCRDAFLDVLRYHILGEININTQIREYQKLSENYGIIPKSAIPGIKLLSIGSDWLNTSNVVEIYDESLNQWIKPNNLAVDRRNYLVALIDGKVMLIGGTQSPDKLTKSLKMVQSLDLSTGLLSTEADLNDARQCSAAVVVGKGKLSFLYVLGGRGKEEDLDSVERWDPLSRVWTRTKSMNNKRKGLAAAVVNGKIYVLGGKIGIEYTNTMEAYSLDDAEWEPKASMKEARAYFCVTVFKDFLYAVAGCKEHQVYLNSVEKYDPFYDSWVTIANIMATGHVGISSLGNRLICAGGKYSKSVLEYNIDIGKWSKLEDLHVPRAGYLLELPEKMSDLQFDWNVQTVPLYSKKLLMIGNQGSNTAIILEVYDDIENQWTRLKDLNIGKINFSVAYIGDNLLMIGGALSDNVDLNAVESLDLRTGKVSQIAPLNCHRQHSAAVVVRLEKLVIIYVFGGTRNGDILSSVERWDFSSRTWTMMTSMTVARTGHGAILLQDEIFVVGGKTGNTYDRTVEAYDFENDSWSMKAPMNNSNAYFGITTFKNCIFVVGGNRDSSTPVNTVERYDPVENVWTTIANISSVGFVGIYGLENKLICAGGKSSNIVEEYDEVDNRWKKLNPSNTQLSGFLTELQPDLEIYLNDWILQKRRSNKLVFLEEDQGKIIETFDVLDKKWKSVKDLPFSKKYFNVNLIDNKLLIIGGQFNESAVKTVDAINLSSGTIESLPPLKEARYSASSVVVQEGNKEILYVLGGEIDAQHMSSSVEIWDPSNNKWTEGVPMTNKRSEFGCAFLNGNIYVVGGYIDESSSDTMEAFNVEQGGKWTTKASMNEDRVTFGITTFKNHIYIAGGDFTFSSVERYDPITDSWTTLANIKSGGIVTLCSIGDRLICAGGDKNYVGEYDVGKNEWVSLPSTKKTIRIGCLLELPENAKLGHW